MDAPEKSELMEQGNSRKENRIRRANCSIYSREPHNFTKLSGGKFNHWNWHIKEL